MGSVRRPPPGLLVAPHLGEIQVDFYETTLQRETPEEHALRLRSVLIGGVLLLAVTTLLSAIAPWWVAVGALLLGTFPVMIAVVDGESGGGPVGLRVPTERRHRRVRLTQSHVEILDGEDCRAIPLEAVTGARRSANYLRISKQKEHLYLFHGIIGNHADWLAELVSAHAERRRAALIAAGQNPDMAARPPKDLQKLIQKR
ncbi:MAG: hypothetical protein AAFV53_35380 [Myxococcota bacterium]